MIKVGLVGGALAYHGFHFSCIMNGCEYDLAVQQKMGVPKLFLGLMQVVKVWDPDPKAARTLARICRIPRVVSRMEEAGRGVDAVFVMDDLTLQHQKRAFPFLKKGIPLFIDKPLSPDLAEAEEICSLARNKRCYLMSGSALRFARESEEAQREIQQTKDRVVTAHAYAPNDLVFYGIHALEFLYPFFRPGVRSVHNVGAEGSDIVAVSFKDGRNMTFQVAKAGYSLGGTLFCQKAVRPVPVRDGDYFYCNMLRHFAVGLESGTPPIPLSEIREVIRTLLLAKLSREQRREITL